MPEVSRVLLSADGDRPVLAAARRRRGTTPVTCSRWSTGPTRPGSPSCCRPAGAGPGGPRRGGADLGRLAVLRRRPGRAAGPGAGAVPGVLRGRPVQLRRPGVLALRVHLGRRRLRAGPRPAPGLPEEVRVDSPDQAAPVRERRPRGSRPAAGSRARWPRPTGGWRSAWSRCARQSPDNGFVNAHPMAHHRWMPSIAPGGPDALDELIQSGSASFEAGPAWRGDATLELFESPDRGTGAAGGRRDHRRLLPAGRRHLGRRPGAGRARRRPSTWR